MWFQARPQPNDARRRSPEVGIALTGDADRFEKIKPSGFAMGSDARELEVADGGWLRGDEDDMKVTVLKGLTVVDLELLAADAGQKGDALTELARQVASKAP